MKRLGELLLERGAIAVSELHTALEACHRAGGRLGTHLLRYGFVDERALLEALSEQFGVPAVTADALQAAPTTVRSLLPPGVQKRLGVVPVKRVGNRLLVAMINPADAAAVEEMASFTRLEIRPEVATESAIAALHADLEEVPEEEEPQPRPVAATPPDPQLWERLWHPIRVPPQEMRGLHRTQPTPAVALLASFPELTPLLDTAGFPSEEAVDEENYVRRLQTVSHRDDVGRLLLSFASGSLSRVVLFAVHKDRILGWMARGPDLVTDDVQSVAIPLDQPSLLLNLMQSGSHYLGAVPPGEANQLLAESLGQPPPRDVVVIPVRIKDRPVAFLLGDSPDIGVAAVPVHELVTAANRAGVAFEILILRSKIRH